MTLLILGIVLWWGAHLFKRVAPDARAGLQARFGDGSKGVIAVVLVLSVILIVIGYRQMDFIPVYGPPAFTVHLNNLLMLLAVICFGMGSSKGRMRSWFRHPMLLGFTLWATAHLLVNGDLASVILFGAMFVWAQVEMVVINRSGDAWVRPEPGPAKGDVRLLVISLVVFAVIGGVHSLLGPWPFPG